MQPESKPIFASKTVAVNAIVILASFYPPVREWVQSHPDTTMQLLAGTAVLLRWITKGRVSLFGA